MTLSKLVQVAVTDVPREYLLQMANVNCREFHTPILASVPNCASVSSNVWKFLHRSFVEKLGLALRWISTISTLRAYYLGSKKDADVGASPAPV